MATATATVLQDWTVSLTTDSAGPGVWRRAVFTGRPDIEVGTRTDEVDRWAPLNTRLRYYWTDDDGVWEAPEVVVASDTPVLSSSLYGGAVRVAVFKQAPMRFEGGSVVHDIIGRSDPLVAVQPAKYPTGTLRLHLPDRSARLDLLSLLADNDPLILRATCTDAVDDMTFVARGWSDPLLAESDPSGGRWLDIDYRAVSNAPMAFREPPIWTWETVEATYATWAEFEDAFESWADAEYGPAP